MAGRTDLEQLVYQMSTDIRQLERQNTRALKSVTGTANKIEGQYRRVSRSGFGAFMDQTLDRSRLAVFELGAARVPVFGQALEALGPAGMAAAAGLAAVAVGATQAIAAMRFADEIDDTAAKLNIGVEALQEYRFALTEVGGEAKDADTAIGDFQKKLGEGLAGGRAIKWFERLGFSKADLEQFESTEAALQAVLDKIAGLGRESERAAVADKLGLGPMIVLAREGSGRLEELRRKARDLGYVMDADLVAKGADANQQFETMSHVVGVQLKSAFVELSDEVLTFTGFIADALKGVNGFIEKVREARLRMSAVYGEEVVRDMAAGNTGQALVGATRAVLSGQAGDAIGVIQRGDSLADFSRRITPDGIRAALGPSTAPAARAGEALENPPAAAPNGRSRGASGPSADEVARRRADLERTLAIEIARLSNNESLVQILERERDIAQRTAQFEAARYDAAAAARLAEAAQLEIDQARADALAQARGAAVDAADLEARRLLGDHAAVAAAERAAELSRLANEYRRQGLTDVAMTVDATGRLVELTDEAAAAGAQTVVVNRALGAAKQDQLSLDRARAEVAARVIADAALEHQITLASLRGDEARLRVLERAAAITRRAREVEGRADLNHGAGVGQATTEVDDEIAAASRRGFRDGVRGLLDDLQGGGLEGVLSSIFDRVSDRLKDNLADLLTDYLMRMARPGAGGGNWAGRVASAALSLIGRRETGGPVRAGVPVIVGEKRPEIFVPQTHGSILPRVSALGRTGGVTARAPVVQQTLIAHLQGAVLATGLVAELKAHGAQIAAAAAGEAYARARSDIPAELAYSRRYSRT